MTINFNDITDTATPTSGTFNTGGNSNVKGAGQNLFLRSTDLTNAAWTSVNLGSVTGGQTDPFGGTTASLFNEGTSTNYHYLNQNPSISTGTYTFSVYAKAGTSNYAGIFATVINQGAIFNLTTGAFTGNYIGAPTSYSSTSVGNGWWRLSIVITGSFGLGIATSSNGTTTTYTGTSQTVYIAAPQLELALTAGTYLSTTTAAIYNTPQLTFSGVANIGLQSDGALFVQPAGTGALQAQATTSSTTGGNARGTYAVDFITLRASAGSVASGAYSVLSGGYNNTASGFASNIAGGYGNTASNFTSSVCGGQFNFASGQAGFIGSGYGNTAGGYNSFVGSGYSNSALGYYNFVGGGFTNSGTSASAVTTQSATMNGTTAVTLSGSNASIKVGQFITGTSIANNTYVAAISGTSLTLSTAATGSSTSTLSFYTPHGIVVGGGNNQATGAYSFIGGGGDAGTAANRNVASGDWSVVTGGQKNTASGLKSFVGGGDINTVSGQNSGLASGNNNSVSGSTSFAGGGQNNTLSGGSAFIGAGYTHINNSNYGFIGSGSFGATRGITSYHVFPACNFPVAFSSGVSQAGLLILGRETTTATATVLTCDSNAASGTNQVILPNNSAYYFKGSVIANVTGAASGAAWSFEGAIMRGANAASTVLIGTPVLNRIAVSSGASLWSIALTADTTNGGLAVTVTGVASTTIRWVAKLETTEVTY